MTIDSYFDRRIRPIVDDTKKGDYSNRYHAKTDCTTPSNSIIDEDQLARTFQEIVNCINLDGDDDETEVDTVNTTNTNTNFSRSNFHHSHHALLPEFKSIFGGNGNNFSVAVGSTGTGSGSVIGAGTGGTKQQSHMLGKSFLDDDWRMFEDSTSFKKGSTGSMVSTSGASGSSVSTSTSSTRPITPSPSNSYFNTATFNSPPTDYVCKLCNRDGHWMKDCRLYEPRTPPASLNSFKSTSSSQSSGGSSVFSSGRTLLPPGNYVCRLCNVAGHWIDQCIKFQPKDASASASGSSSSGSNIPGQLPPMLGPGPTPNYRPPAYLSKPVPSNYLCNLCNRPGHWIQQCTEFTPIINSAGNKRI